MPASFRRSVLALAIPAMFSAVAGATEYVWVTGSFGPLVAPGTLDVPDTLAIEAGGAKTFSSTSFTNNSTVNWNADDVGFVSSLVTNAGTWDSKADHGLVYSGGSGSTFINSGVFRKSAGTGTTSVASASITFVNTGIVDAQTGTIAFLGSNASFQDGSVFQGAGVVNVASSASFSGTIQSQNLLLSAGNFSGGGAVLNGTTVWTGGQFTGAWSVAANQTVSVEAGGSKNFESANFVNAGTLAWDTTGRTGFVSSVLTNEGLLDLRQNADFHYAGGSGSTVINKGVLRKSGADGISAFTSANVAFLNAGGVVDAQTGTLDFAGANATFENGTQFTGGGTVRVSHNAQFNGNFESANLVLAGGTYQGGNAVAHGTVDWTGGTFSGNWRIAPDQVLNASGNTTKNFSSASFTNMGTVNWSTEARAGFLSSLVTNEGLWDLKADADFAYAGSSSSTFVNSGILRKSGGAGVAEFKTNVAFVNTATGVIDVQVGTLSFANHDSQFQAGTRFTGAGSSSIVSNAAFAGAFTSENLVLAAGSFQGSDAVLNGTVQWTGGAFSGNWQVAPGQVLIALGDSNKNFSSASFTNKGTVRWSTGNRAGFLSSLVTNEGLWDVQTDADFAYAGSSGSTFINSGTLRKSGDGVTLFGTNVAFVNHGVVEVLAGTFQLPNNFDNPGVITGDGIVKTNTLTNSGTLKPGDGVGTLTLESNLVEAAGGIIEIEVGGTDDHDVLAVTGNATLGGTLAVRRAGGFMPTVGDSFIVMTFASRLGGSTFLGDPTVLGWGNGVDFDVIYGEDKVTLEVTAVPEPGTVALMAGGLAVLGCSLRRRRTA